jgi:molybdate transport system ATP-binding protein
VSEPKPPALEARFRVTVGAPRSSFSVEAELAVATGILVLFGPSGSGKSLTLQAIAGLLRPTQGFVRVEGLALFDRARRIDVPVHKRRLGYVPQFQSLFPFLDVASNIAFGLPRADRKAERPAIVALLEELGIAHLARAHPADLSGGERQRVALARALAVKPRLLLLDEPFASIDQDGRTALREVLRDTLQRRAVPAVFVTHDPDEALQLGDTLVRFERGRTAESGLPDGLLRRGQAVTVSGQPSEPVDLGDGRARVTLRNASVEGPSEMLKAREDEPLTLSLRTRPRAPRE